MDNGTKTSDAVIGTVSATAWKIVAAGDYNSDGKTDIIWRNTSNGKMVVWYMDGATKTSDAMIGTVSNTSWKIVGFGSLE